MNVTCPTCSTVFRVDPARVPAGGVRARCSVCRGVFPVGIAETPPAPAPVVAAVAAPPLPPPPAP
ncbi:MAG: zinc-ribbon domain-containing protein, partial [Gemmatimonadales bacterium]